MGTQQNTSSSSTLSYFLVANAVVFIGTLYAFNSSLPNESYFNPGYQQRLEANHEAGLQIAFNATILFDLVCGVTYAIAECCKGSVTEQPPINHQITHFKKEPKQAVTSADDIMTPAQQF